MFQDSGVEYVINMACLLQPTVCNLGLNAVDIRLGENTEMLPVDLDGRKEHGCTLFHACA